MLLALPAIAQTSRSADAWEFEITPYGWLMGLKGQNQIGSFPPTSVNLSASDVIDHLDFAVFGLFEARKGAYSMQIDH
jgi:hypothetical protein